MGDAKYVFGGYTSTPWKKGGVGVGVACRDAFLCSVTSPHTDGAVVRWSVRQPGHAIFCNKAYGPVFGAGHDLAVSGGGKLNAKLNGESCCGLSGRIASYDDVLAQGNFTFNGARNFTPVDIEVYTGVL